jgi:hypothetical protein
MKAMEGIKKILIHAAKNSLCSASRLANYQEDVRDLKKKLADQK